MKFKKSLLCEKNKIDSTLKKYYEDQYNVHVENLNKIHAEILQKKSKENIKISNYENKLKKLEMILRDKENLIKKKEGKVHRKNTYLNSVPNLLNSSNNMDDKLEEDQKVDEKISSIQMNNLKKNNKIEVQSQKEISGIALQNPNIHPSLHLPNSLNNPMALTQNNNYKISIPSNFNCSQQEIGISKYDTQQLALESFKMPKKKLKINIRILFKRYQII